MPWAPPRGWPDIYIDVDVRDVRVLEFFKSREVFRQAQPAKDQLKRELEAKLARRASPDATKLTDSDFRSRIRFAII